MVATQLGLEIKQERRRLSAQCALILGRLQRGPVSNKELAGISLKYTGRISDLRQKGHDVRVIWRDRVTGESLYALFVDDERWR